MRRLLILGSTGSIGTQALEVAAVSESFEVVGLAADRSFERLLAQAEAHGVKRVALADPASAARAADAWSGGEVLSGAEGLVDLVTESGCDLVLNALVGSAGLGPTVAALGEGTDLALANKESLVVGGDLVMALAEATGARVIPVDSEHSALDQLVASQRPGTVDRLVLTASGGPFRGRSPADLAEVVPEEALAHPTWEMGGKITIDSATLMNKGLELIEAHHLFGLAYDRIDVVVHPQSIVHALVHLNDGASLAHLGYPDMRVPISYALHYPERADVPVETLDLAAVGELTFEPPDLEAFACLRLARQAAALGGTAPCILNAANEVAVRAFLDRRLPFAGIAEVIERVLERTGTGPVAHFEDLYRADAEAREAAGELVGAGGCVSWFLAFVGFALLIILHEAGHFAAAKAVGMRVERFALFFPPLIVKRKIGETEYGIGAIPLGGYVKITGMNPDEKLPDEVRTRAYSAQPVWKRIVVIAAGPAVNFVLALVLLFLFFWQIGPEEQSDRVGGVQPGYPAATELEPGDRLVAVDGESGTPTQFAQAIASHRCSGEPVEGCRAESPAELVIERDGREMELELTPVYDPAAPGGGRTRLGFEYAPGPHRPLSFGESVDVSLDQFWFVTRETLKLPARLLNAEQRKEISGVVGSYEVTRQTILDDVARVLPILAVISLSLAIINLFPFLPLDGGHIFWAIVEKIRRKPASLATMERASLIGIMLLIPLFLIGFTNDIGRLTGEGFDVR